MKTDETGCWISDVLRQIDIILEGLDPFDRIEDIVDRVALDVDLILPVLHYGSIYSVLVGRFVIEYDPLREIVIQHRPQQEPC